jgi:hypothetical protein
VILVAFFPEDLRVKRVKFVKKLAVNRT